MPKHVVYFHDLYKHVCSVMVSVILIVWFRILFAYDWVVFRSTAFSFFMNYLDLLKIYCRGMKECKIVIAFSTWINNSTPVWQTYDYIISDIFSTNNNRSYCPLPTVETLQKKYHKIKRIVRLLLLLWSFAISITCI